MAALPFCAARNIGVAPSRFGGSRVRAGANQRLGHVEVVPPRRPVQRRRAVGLRSVHIRFLADQGTNGLAVLAHRRVRDIADRSRETDRGQQDRATTDAKDVSQTHSDSLTD